MASLQTQNRTGWDGWLTSVLPGVAVASSIHLMSAWDHMKTLFQPDITVPVIAEISLGELKIKLVTSPNLFDVESSYCIATNGDQLGMDTDTVAERFETSNSHFSKYKYGDTVLLRLKDCPTKLSRRRNARLVWLDEALVYALTSVSRAGSQQSVSLSTLGAGSKGCNPDDMVALIFKVVTTYLSKNPDNAIKEITIVDSGQDIKVSKEFEDHFLRFNGVVESPPSNSSLPAANPVTGTSSGATAISSGSTREPKDWTHHIVGQLDVKLVIGSLSDCKTDVIVNTTGRNLNLSSGQVSSALLAKAGSQLQQECSRHQSLAAGEILKTDAYQLPCKRVFHCCCESARSKSTEQTLKDIVIGCLRLAASQGYSSIAFPALGTGKLGFHPRLVYAAMISAVKDYQEDTEQIGTSISEVCFVVYHSDTITKKLFEEMFSSVHRSYSWLHNIKSNFTFKAIVDDSGSVHSVEDNSDLLEGVCALFEEPKLHEPPQQASVFPSFWKDPTDQYQEVTLEEMSQEREEVAEAFRLSMKDRKRARSLDILSIKRIQNPLSYQQYSIQRNHVTKVLTDAGVGEPVERKLWHGTSADSIEKITHSKFDRGVAGKNGTQYGQGSYFATNASYSHQYSSTKRLSSYQYSQQYSSSQSTYFMIGASVITGRYTAGDRSMKTAPYLPSSNYRQYDSVVDKMADPNIFVVFNDASAYPEYIIEYTTKDYPSHF